MKRFLTCTILATALCAGAVIVHIHSGLACCTWPPPDCQLTGTCPPLAK
jgi:hypothetical protein